VTDVVDGIARGGGGLPDREDLLLGVLDCFLELSGVKAEQFSHPRIDVPLL